MSGTAGGGASGTGAAGTTFAQPGSPTQGLQRYNLEGAAKNLIPGSPGKAKKRAWLKGLAALRGDQTARHSARQTRGHSAALKKDFQMLRGTIEAMVGTLSKTVSDIHAAGGDPALLTKTFTEFTDGLAGAVEGDLAKRAPAEEALHKGLGTVGRVANLLGTVAPTVEAIKAGYDNKWQMPCDSDSNSGRTQPSDPASADVADLLEAVVHAAELALRAAVNEHVDLADDADTAPGATLPPGMHLIMVPDHDDPETKVVVKTMLPEDLAKLATDPAALQDGIIEQGLALLAAAGVPDEALGKLFAEDSDELGKQFPPKKKTPADMAGGDSTQDSDATTQAAPANSDGSTGAADAGAGAGDGGEATDTSGMGGDASTADDPNGDDPISVAQRIWAALGIQLQHIAMIVSGGAPDESGDASDTGTDLAAGGDTAVSKGVRTLDLAKRATPAAAAEPSAEVTALTKMVTDQAATIAALKETSDELAKGVTLLLNQPAPAKGAVKIIPAPPKQDDTGGTLNKGADAAEKLQEELSKLSPEDRAFELIKISQRLPEPNARAAAR